MIKKGIGIILLKLKYSMTFKLVLAAIFVGGTLYLNREPTKSISLEENRRKVDVIDYDKNQIDSFTSQRLRKQEISIKDLDAKVKELSEGIQNIQKLLTQKNEDKIKENEELRKIKDEVSSIASVSNSRVRNTTKKRTYKRRKKKKRYETPNGLQFKQTMIEKKIQIPSGSRINATILNGTKGTMGAPEPVVMVLSGTLKMPNNRKFDLSGCFALGKAQVKLSSSRSDLLIDTLSCIKGDDKPIQVTKLMGFIVDREDGFNGARGEMGSPEDNSILSASLAKMFERAAQIASVQGNQQINSQSPLGTVRTIIGAATGKQIIGGAVEGGASIIANWWQKTANLQVPHLKVKNGKKVVLTFIRPFSLPLGPFENERDLNENRKRFIF